MRVAKWGGLLLALCMTGAATAQVKSADGMWTMLEEMPIAAERGEAWIRPQFFRPVQLDVQLAREVLAEAPMEFTQQGFEQPMLIELPNPDGGFSQFLVVESPIMEPALAAQYPQIRTYAGQGVTDPAETVRFDLTPQGFHAQVLGPGGTWLIDPYTRNDTLNYTTYWRRDYSRDAGHNWTCFFDDRQQPMLQRRRDEERLSNGGTLRQYRLAVTANVEYSSFHGGTTVSVLAAINTAMNRVNGVYERDLCVRMNIVANNNLIVFLAEPDGLTNNNAGQMINANTGIINGAIGSANYDIGHVFSTGGGGIAGLGVVCTGSKGAGVTGQAAPTGDVFWIDYVAHEMGHQFGANHTFNGTNSACSGGNRSAAHAYEPGSGATIMAYAGICGTTCTNGDNLQCNSDDYFHSDSLDAIISFTSSGSGSFCDAASATGNTLPSVNAGLDYTIPANTPFELTAVASDANGDTLTYCWEERDLGAAQGNAAGIFVDNGTSPFIRSFDPDLSPTRVIPRIPNLIANTFFKGERLPVTNRTINFRCTVRDNRAGGGAVQHDDIVLTSTTSAGPFLVTSPNTAVSWSGMQTVTWNVANTSSAPVNCANVSILLSTDGGVSFPTVLVASTPNDGSESVTLPAIATSQARIKVKGVNNVFFDISNTNFTITAPPAPGNFNLVSPSDGATDVATNPTLQWSASANALNYTVEVDDEASFSMPLAYSNTTAGLSVALAPATLAEGTQYFWRVTAGNGTGTALSGGAPWSFTTEFTCCLGNANGDSIVDFDDLVTILGNWLEASIESSPNLNGDSDCDGDVDFDDLVATLGAWLNVCP